MPQDSSFCSNSTINSSEGKSTKDSKIKTLVTDMSGSFFVLKQTIDAPKYQKWLHSEPEKIMV